MDKNKPIIIDYSLEGTDITHEVNADGYLIVKSKGMTIKSAEKVTEETNLNTLALAMYEIGIETLRKNEKTIKITIYKDTVNHKYNGDDNLLNVEVTRDFAELYFLDKVYKEDYRTFDDFINNYTADYTEDFYEFAKQYNAIIKIEEV